MACLGDGTQVTNALLKYTILCYQHRVISKNCCPGIYYCPDSLIDLQTFFICRMPENGNVV